MEPSDKSKGDGRNQRRDIKEEERRSAALGEAIAE